MEAAVSVGTELADARARRGLSLDDVSEATSIRTAVIAAIEADDFGPSGGPAYARGHVRALARCLGLDGVALVARFDSQVSAGEPAGPIAEALVAASAAERELTHVPALRWARLLGLFVLGAAVAVGVAVGVHALIRR